MADDDVDKKEAAPQVPGSTPEPMRSRESQNTTTATDSQAFGAGYDTIAMLTAAADQLEQVSTLPWALTIVEHEPCADYLRSIGVVAVSMSAPRWQEAIPADAAVLLVDRCQRVAGDLAKHHGSVCYGVCTPLPSNHPSEFLESRAAIAKYDVDDEGLVEVWRAVVEHAHMVEVAPTDHPAFTRRQQPLRIPDVLESWARNGPVVRYATGIAGLDQQIGGGIPQSTLSFALGGPDAGKTLFLKHLASRFASDGVVVGMLQVDEDPDGMVTRFAQSQGIARRDCEQRRPETLRAIGAACGRLQILFFDEDHTVEQAAKETADYARSIGAPAALLVDSLQTVRCQADTNQASRYDAITERVAVLKRMARTYRMAVVCTSEQNRPQYRANGRDPAVNEMAGGSGSGAIEYQGKTLLTLRAIDNDRIELRVTKSKFGRRHLPNEQGIGLAFDRDLQQIHEIVIGGANHDDERDALAAKAGELRARVVRTVADMGGFAPSARVIVDRTPGKGGALYAAIKDAVCSGALLPEGKGYRIVPAASHTTASPLKGGGSREAVWDTASGKHAGSTGKQGSTTDQDDDAWEAWRFRGWVFQRGADDLPHLSPDGRWVAAISSTTLGYVESCAHTVHESRVDAIAHVRADLDAARARGSLVDREIRFSSPTNAEQSYAESLASWADLAEPGPVADLDDGLPEQPKRRRRGKAGAA